MLIFVFLWFFFFFYFGLVGSVVWFCCCYFTSVVGMSSTGHRCPLCHVCGKRLSTEDPAVHVFACRVLLTETSKG